MTDVAVSIPPNRAAGTVQRPMKLPPNPANDFAVIRVKPIETVREGRDWFKARINDGHHPFSRTLPFDEAITLPSFFL
jgi:esterase/lipase superfamily enzyme